VIESDSSRVLKKFGELWSTNYRVLHVSLGPLKWNFSADYISALRYDYNPTTMYRARPLSIRRKQKFLVVVVMCRIVVVSHYCDTDLRQAASYYLMSEDVTCA